jgi:hypothetical protein
MKNTIHRCWDTKWKKLYKHTNYQIAFYNGKRRAYKGSRGVLYVEKHIEYINNNIPDIGLVSFIINKSYESLDNELVEFIDNSDINFNYEIILRDNVGFSYGAWEEVMRKNYVNYDYAFIIEDDYIPSKPDTLQYFYRKFTENEHYIYVCSLWYDNRPSISNGMIRTELFRDPDNLNRLKVYRGGGYVGKVGDNNGYTSEIGGGYNQTHFMSEFVKDKNPQGQRYYVTDITDIGHTVFYRYVDISKGNRIIFNNSELPLLIEPI